MANSSKIKTFLWFDGQAEMQAMMKKVKLDIAKLEEAAK